MTYVTDVLNEIGLQAHLKVIDNAFVDNVANGYWCDLGCTNGTITGNAVSGSFDVLLDQCPDAFFADAARARNAPHLEQCCRRRDVRIQTAAGCRH